MVSFWLYFFNIVFLRICIFIQVFVPKMQTVGVTDGRPDRYRWPFGPAKPALAQCRFLMHVVILLRKDTIFYTQILFNLHAVHSDIFLFETKATKQQKTPSEAPQRRPGGALGVAQASP